MSNLNRTLSILFTSLPALVWGTLVFLPGGREYYWTFTYRLVVVFFLVASFFLGGGLPGLVPKAWSRHPGWWLAGQGAFAWGVALLALGLLNLTPLCIGQDNGDGINDLALCMLQTTLVGFVYSIPELVLLILIAIPGGLVIKKLNILAS